MGVELSSCRAVQSSQHKSCEKQEGEKERLTFWVPPSGVFLLQTEKILCYSDLSLQMSRAEAAEHVANVQFPLSSSCSTSLLM